jgi:hypothetical protein
VAILDFLKSLLTRKEVEKNYSAYALMQNGSMKKESLSLVIYTVLMKEYNKEYVDTDDKDTVFAAISANFQNESEIAWHAFLSEVGFDE